MDEPNKTEKEISKQTNNEKTENKLSKSSQRDANNSGNRQITGKNKKGKTGKKQLNKSTDEVSEQIVTRADVHIDADIGIKEMLKKMSNDMHSMQDILTKRMDMIENKIEQSEKTLTDKITDKVTKIIDNRVSTEVSKIRKEIDDKLSDLRTEFNADLVEINKRIEQRASSEAGNRVVNVDETQNRHDISLNIVIRELPETTNENVVTKVDALIKDGLKIRNLTAVTAVRKASRTENKPGIIIATLRSSEDKKKIMTSKKMLKGHSSYGTVYINHDQTTQERRLASNMRTLVEAVRRGDSSIAVRGTKVITTNNRDEEVNRGTRHVNNRGGYRSGRQSTYTHNTRRDYNYTRNNRDARDNRDNNSNTSHNAYESVRRDNNDRNNWQGSHYRQEQSPNTDQEWDTARRDGRHRGTYSRNGNYRQNRY